MPLLPALARRRPAERHRASAGYPSPPQRSASRAIAVAIAVSPVASRSTVPSCSASGSAVSAPAWRASSISRAAESMPALVVPRPTGYPAGERQPAQRLLGWYRFVAERAQGSLEYRRTHAVSVGDQRRQAVQQQVGGMWRPRSARRSDGLGDLRHPVGQIQAPRGQRGTERLAEQASRASCRLSGSRSVKLMPSVSAARANSVAGGLAASPGQRPVPAEQDLREAFHGFLAGPVPLQLTPHLDHAGRLAAGLGDALQSGLMRLG